jgi:hypothetical protein
MSVNHKRTAAIFSTDHEVSLLITHPLDKKKVSFREFKNFCVSIWRFFTEFPFLTSTYKKFSRCFFLEIFKM